MLRGWKQRQQNLFLYIYIYMYLYIQTDRYRYMVWITCGSSSFGACLSCYSSRSFTEGPTTVSAQIILSFGYSSPYRHVSERITDRILLLIWQMARTSFWWVLCKWKPETIFRLCNNSFLQTTQASCINYEIKQTIILYARALRSLGFSASKTCFLGFGEIVFACHTISVLELEGCKIRY